MADFNKYLIKVFTITFIVIALLGAGMFYLSKDINKRVEKIQNLQNQIAKNLEEANAFAALRPDYNKAKEINLVLNNYFPSKEDVAINFKTFIETLAKKNKIASPNFSFTGEGILTNEGFTRTSFTLNFYSFYDDLVKFLKEAEENHFTIKFISPTILKEENTNKFNVVIPGQVFSF